MIAKGTDNNAAAMTAVLATRLRPVVEPGIVAHAMDCTQGGSAVVVVVVLVDEVDVVVGIVQPKAASWRATAFFVGGARVHLCVLGWSMCGRRGQPMKRPFMRR